MGQLPTESVEQDAQRMNDFIEARVREQPEQYFGCTSVLKRAQMGKNRFILESKFQAA